MSLLLVALALLMIFLGWSTPLPKGWHWYSWSSQAIGAVGYIGAPVLGGLVASRRSANPLGWLWLGVGLGFAFGAFASAYATYAVVVQPGALPAPRTIAASVEPVGYAVAVTLMPFLFLLFPNGRLPSQRWRLLGWIVIAGGAVLLIVASLETYPSPYGDPFGARGIVGEAVVTVGNSTVVILSGAIVLSALSVMLRYRHATGVERQQIKWFAYAMVLLCGTILLNGTILISMTTPWLNNLIFTVGLVGLYTALGVAMLRYRLYDIDLLINRTLVYGSLTAVLAISYEGGIVALQHVFRLLSAQESQATVVATTLVIAAMFEPLRRRIQHFVDRRFYRRKYDAAKTLEAFAAKLRDETDLDALSYELAGVVRETMHPAHTSLWLRPDPVPKHTKRAAVRGSSHDE